MPAEFEVVWDDEALSMLPDSDIRVAVEFDRLANEAVLTMKRLCPVSPVGKFHRSGQLRSSVHAFRGGNAHVRWWTIGPTADYAKYVELDTVPHLIESHGPWSLHNAETGEYFGRVVHHPGTRGQHFILRTAETFQGRVIHL